MFSRHNHVYAMALVLQLLGGTLALGQMQVGTGGGFQQRYSHMRQSIVGMAREGQRATDRARASEVLEALELSKQRIEEELAAEVKSQEIIADLRNASSSSQHSPQDLRRAEEISKRNQRTLKELIVLIDEESKRVKNHLKSLKPSSMDSTDYIQNSK
jgi:dihydropteroate synthase